jgi:hypothetical protein
MLYADKNTDASTNITWNHTDAVHADVSTLDRCPWITSSRSERAGLPRRIERVKNANDSKMKALPNKRASS